VTNPPNGTFTQEDPIGIAGGLNHYGYANGDPINFSDPFGLFTQACPTTNTVSPGAVNGSQLLGPFHFLGTRPSNS
jgi:uncharacterized protein RhaS with RHS repeats